MFELQCLALRKDSKMYKERMEAILQQMEEVAIERDQVGACHPHVAGQGQGGAVPTPGRPPTQCPALGEGQLSKWFLSNGVNSASYLGPNPLPGNPPSTFC